MKNIKKCPACSKYTLSEKCSCKKKAVSPKPPKFSPEDKYAKYRRKAKREEWEKKGYL
ncbi:RNA-protein complex protein Nop10 [Candidatus Woesearchaeota archaeon]|nr:RNA-protein complex protein Nop10 [Candidatus Woesearchaeota archaeon]